MLLLGSRLPCTASLSSPGCYMPFAAVVVMLVIIIVKKKSLAQRVSRENLLHMQVILFVVFVHVFPTVCFPAGARALVGRCVLCGWFELEGARYIKGAAFKQEVLELQVTLANLQDFVCQCCCCSAAACCCACWFRWRRGCSCAR